MKGTIVEGSRGRYAILAEAGEGGAGTVYKAKGISSGTIVALKVLHSKRFELNDIQRERFLNEIAASLNLSSDYIVAGLDSGEYNGEPFLVLEWLSGGTLQQLIESGDYGTDDVISITAQLLKAFRDLQRLGLVHRDLKPNNVLLTTDRRIKLSDLGLVRKVAAPAYLTASNAQIGSLLYISDRQRFDPSKASPRDDFYSLSLILYELVSRRRIHNRNAPLELLRPPVVPMALSRLIDKCMQDLGNWQEVCDEICSYIDLDGECINSQYTGSVLISEHLIQAQVDDLFRRYKSESNSTTSTSDVVVASAGDLLPGIIRIVERAFVACAAEIEHCGVLIDMYGDADEGLYYSATFDDRIKSLLLDLNIYDLVVDRLWGIITFDTAADGSIGIYGIYAKRLDMDGTYLPEDTFERRIVNLDEDAEAFLQKLGRGLAVGAAIGAIVRIDEVWEEEKEES